jgi:hypothetical protein
VNPATEIEATTRPLRAEMYLEMYRTIDGGKVRAAEPRMPESTSGTTLEEWAACECAAAYNGTGPAPRRRAGPFSSLGTEAGVPGRAPTPLFFLATFIGYAANSNSGLLSRSLVSYLRGVSPSPQVTTLSIGAFILRMLWFWNRRSRFFSAAWSTSTGAALAHPSGALEQPLCALGVDCLSASAAVTWGGQVEASRSVRQTDPANLWEACGTPPTARPSVIPH